MYRTARTTPLSRLTLLAKADRFGVSEAARQMGVSRRTVQRWRRRRGELEDRPCRPHRSPRRTGDQLEAAVLGLRLELRWGPDRLGPYLGLPVSTTHRILRRWNAHRLRTLFPVERRTHVPFAVSEPGEVMALDIKSLGRLDYGGGRQARHHSLGAGWHHLHIAIDLASRLVYAEVRGGLGKADTVDFLRHALAFFDARGIRVQRVLTDNGVGYRRIFREACSALGLRHTRTKPYHPWTNGRAEAFIGSIQRECTQAVQFSSNDERRLAIALWVAYYNTERPHLGLGGLAPLDWLRRHHATRVYEDFT
jgi:transposase InsO family protein